MALSCTIFIPFLFLYNFMYMMCVYVEIFSSIAVSVYSEEVITANHSRLILKLALPLSVHNHGPVYEILFISGS